MFLVFCRNLWFSPSLINWNFKFSTFYFIMASEISYDVLTTFLKISTSKKFQGKLKFQYFKNINLVWSHCHSGPVRKPCRGGSRRLGNLLSEWPINNCDDTINTQPYYAGGEGYTCKVRRWRRRTTHRRVRETMNSWLDYVVMVSHPSYIRPG